MPVFTLLVCRSCIKRILLVQDYCSPLPKELCLALVHNPSQAFFRRRPTIPRESNRPACSLLFMGQLEQLVDLKLRNNYVNVSLSQRRKNRCAAVNRLLFPSHVKNGCSLWRVNRRGTASRGSRMSEGGIDSVSIIPTNFPSYHVFFSSSLLATAYIIAIAAAIVVATTVANSVAPTIAVAIVIATAMVTGRPFDLACFRRGKVSRERSRVSKTFQTFMLPCLASISRPRMMLSRSLVPQSRSPAFPSLSPPSLLYAPRGMFCFGVGHPPRRIAAHPSQPPRSSCPFDSAGKASRLQRRPSQGQEPARVERPGADEGVGHRCLAPGGGARSCAGEVCACVRACART